MPEKLDNANTGKTIKDRYNAINTYIKPVLFNFSEEGKKKLKPLYQELVNKYNHGKKMSGDALYNGYLKLKGDLDNEDLAVKYGFFSWFYKLLDLSKPGAEKILKLIENEIENIKTYSNRIKSLARKYGALVLSTGEQPEKASNKNPRKDPLFNNSKDLLGIGENENLIAYNEEFINPLPDLKIDIDTYFVRNFDPLQKVLIRIFWDKVITPINKKIKSVVKKNIFTSAFKRDLLRAARAILQTLILNVVGYIANYKNTAFLAGNLKSVINKIPYVRLIAANSEKERNEIKEDIKIFNNLVDVVCVASKGLNPIMKRKQNDIISHRLSGAKFSYLRRVAFLIIREYMNAKEGSANKYLMEFLARTLTKIKDDNELFAYLNHLKPTLKKALLNTKLADKAAKQLYGQKINFSSLSQEKKEKILEMIFSMVFPPDKQLTPEEEKSDNSKMIANWFENIKDLLKEYAKVAPEASLMSSMILDNLKIRLIRINSGQNKQKAQEDIDLLVNTLKSFISQFGPDIMNKVRITLQRKNPLAASILDQLEIFINSTKFIGRLDIPLQQGKNEHGTFILDLSKSANSLLLNINRQRKELLSKIQYTKNVSDLNKLQELDKQIKNINLAIFMISRIKSDDDFLRIKSLLSSVLYDNKSIKLDKKTRDDLLSESSIKTVEKANKLKNIKDNKRYLDLLFVGDELSAALVKMLDPVFKRNNLSEVLPSFSFLLRNQILKYFESLKAEKSFSTSIDFFRTYKEHSGIVEIITKTAAGAGVYGLDKNVLRKNVIISLNSIKRKVPTTIV